MSQNREQVDYDSEPFPVGSIRDHSRTQPGPHHTWMPSTPALSQAAPFDFNVIVVDNDSTDGTRELFENVADPRLILIKADSSENLGIEAAGTRRFDPRCGRFAIQLDSDDLYNLPA